MESGTNSIQAVGRNDIAETFSISKLGFFDHVWFLWKMKYFTVMFPVLTSIAAGITSFFLPKLYDCEGVIRVGTAHNLGLVQPLSEVRAWMSSLSFMSEIIDSMGDELPADTEPGDLKFRTWVYTESNLIRFKLLAQKKKAAVGVIEKIVEKIISRHKTIFDEAQKANYAMLRDIEERIAEISEQIKEYANSLKNIRVPNAYDPTTLIFVQNDLISKEHKLEELVKERNIFELRISAAQSYNTYLLEKPYVSNVPARPRKKLIVALSFFSSFLIGLVGAYAIDSARRWKNMKG